METILIVIHLIVVVALVGVIMLQKSEGGGLGVGGGSGFMTARGAANTLTRTTAILATIFFVTSLSLSMLARYGAKPTDILDRVPASSQTGGNGVLDQLPGGSTAPTEPANSAPAPAVPSGNDSAAPSAQPATGAAPAAEVPAVPATPQVPN